MDRFFIAPLDKSSGLVTATENWLIPDEAFSQIKNAYVYRGRVRKRFGSYWFGNDQTTSRLAVQIGTTNGASTQTITVPLPTEVGAVPGAIGQAFSINGQVLTVYQATGAMYASGSITGTFNTTSGVVVFSGISSVPTNTPIYWYPSLPVMGFVTFQTSVAGNANPTYAFDTRYAYQFINNQFIRISAESNSGAATWQGSDYQFFWGATYTGITGADQFLFVTNFNQNETNNMRYLDASSSWHNFAPQVDNTPNYMFAARILVAFKNTLIAFDTWEGPNTGAAVNYKNRARWCALNKSPVVDGNWNRDIPGLGGGLDCPTIEDVITVEFVKDRLIVFMEQSTWEFVDLGNTVNPFRWQQINTEWGADSTFSIVPFDKVAIGMGNFGVLACNGQNVERVDDKIPQLVFNIQNSFNGRSRVYGIRDYYTELVYWTYPNTDRTAEQYFPNQVLIYNYKNGTWAINDDSITAFGYLQIAGADDANDITWDSTTVTWDDTVPWGGASVQAEFPNVIAGNQQGFVYIVDPDITTNETVFQITNITITAGIITIESINHGINENAYIWIQGVTGSGTMTSLNGQIWQIDTALGIDQNDFSFADSSLTGTYTGGGTYGFVSEISIMTKEFNFYREKGMNAYIEKIDFYVDSTPSGQLEVDFYVNTNAQSGMTQGLTSGSTLGTGLLDTFPYTYTIPSEADQTRLWHPVYFQGDGEGIQIQLSLGPEQMLNPAIQVCDFQLHAMCISAMPTASRLG